MWFKNKKTGLKFDVVDELIERLKKDPDFELVKETKKEVKKDELKEEPSKKKPAKK